MEVPFDPNKKYFLISDSVVVTDENPLGASDKWWGGLSPIDQCSPPHVTPAGTPVLYFLEDENCWTINEKGERMAWVDMDGVMEGDPCNQEIISPIPQEIWLTELYWENDDNRKDTWHQVWGTKPSYQQVLEDRFENEADIKNVKFTRSDPTAKEFEGCLDFDHRPEGETDWQECGMRVVVEKRALKKGA